jgi:ankyrin repeat protein
VDNSNNTALHLATLNGHTSIVSLLCEHGAEISVKNDENLTPFYLSCRNGFYEISKTLIANYSTQKESTKWIDDYPLHTASYEGAYEVVKLILQKESLFKIDQLNDENKNCLDIAISRGNREVITTLLDHPNWYKLIQNNSSCIEELNSEENMMLLINPLTHLKNIEIVKALFSKHF